jgi:hypothetical protein
MNLKKWLTVVLFCAPVWLFSQTAAQPASPAAVTAAQPAGTITDIVITGLKRTKPHIARYPLEQFIGRDAASLDLNEVRGAVIGTGVLEPAGITLEPAADGNGVVLHAAVEEKWSFVPMPMLMVSGNSAAGGLFLMDTNAFGLRDQFVAGGMYGTAGWMAMFMYNATPDRKGVPGWRTSFMYGRGDRQNVDSGERLLRHYKTDTLNASAGLDYPVTGFLGLSFGFSYSDISITERIFRAPENGLRSLGFTPALSLHTSSWDGYLSSEHSLSLSYTYNLALQGDSWQTVEARAVSAVPVVPGFVVSLRSAALWQPGGSAVVERHPALANILPGSFVAAHYASFQAGMEKYLVRTRFGTLSVIGAWQTVFASAGDTGDTFDHGPVAGMRFYLSRVAIPALGFGLGYNMNTGICQITFNVGMSF